jgi:hypothetical protein
MRKIIGIYVIICSLSGILFIVSLAWMIFNLSNIKAGEEATWFNYIFGINMYILGGLLILGLVGIIVYLIDNVFKYISKNR